MSGAHGRKLPGGARGSEQIWIATRSGVTLTDFLAQQGAEDPAAIAAGRVFVDRVRANNGGTLLSAGTEVVLRQPRPRIPAPALLGERDGLLAVEKPAGMPTEPDRREGAQSLVLLVATAIGAKAGELHAATRLDLPVSGVVLLARGAAARRRVERLREDGLLSRIYLALAVTAPEPRSGHWRGSIAHGSASGTRAAHTRYTTVATAPRGVHPTEPPAALLLLAPTTGRTHQLRLHAAGAGVPLLGDAEQGGPRRLTTEDGAVTALDRIALHAARLTLKLPGEAPWVIAAPVPQGLRDWWERLGGEPEAWSAALSTEP